VRLTFRGYQPAAEALSESWGMQGMPALFVINAMNNLFWWAIDRHVLHLWAKDADGPRTLCCAMSLTMLSVVIFAINRHRWRTHLAKNNGVFEGSILWGTGDLDERSGKALWKKLRTAIKTKKLMADHHCHTDNYFEHRHSGPWMPLELQSKPAKESPIIPIVTSKIWAGNDVQIAEGCTTLDDPSVTLGTGQKARVLEVDTKGRAALDIAGVEHWCQIAHIHPLDIDAPEDKLMLEECVTEVRSCCEEYEKTCEVVSRPRAAWFQHLTHWALTMQRTEALKDKAQ